jgi:hypothetical protein
VKAAHLHSKAVNGAVSFPQNRSHACLVQDRVGREGA